MTTKDEQSFFDFLKEYWYMIVFIGSLIVTWASVQVKTSDYERRIVKLESKVEIADQNYIQIQKDIVELKTILNERLPAKN